MKLSIGIVGLPNVGKSTLFNTVTKQEIEAANYPFCTIDPNIGIVPVPDERLDKLSDLSKSEKKIPAIIELYDIAGLVRGAAKGEGLGNQFLGHIKEVDAVLVVLRCFEDENVVHVEENIDPVRDLKTVNNELQLKDLETIEKRIPKLESEVKSGSKEAKQNLELIQKLKIKLENEELITEFSDEPFVKELQLLTGKKQLYLLNGEEKDVPDELKKEIENLGGEYIITDLANAGDSIIALIQSAYKTLNLISYFTTGPKETRAWTIAKGSLAPQAAGVIHTDFEKKFIRAEAILWDKLLESGDWVQAKRKGLIRMEGKAYEVQDGDVLIIHHS